MKPGELYRLKGSQRSYTTKYHFCIVLEPKQKDIYVGDAGGQSITCEKYEHVLVLKKDIIVEIGLSTYAGALCLYKTKLILVENRRKGLFERIS